MGDRAGHPNRPDPKMPRYGCLGCRSVLEGHSQQVVEIQADAIAIDAAPFVDELCELVMERLPGTEALETFLLGHDVARRRGQKCRALRRIRERQLHLAIGGCFEAEARRVQKITERLDVTPPTGRTAARRRRGKKRAEHRQFRNAGD